MAREIIWSPLALDDLRGIASYISRDSKVYAEAVVHRIMEATDSLAVFPYIGRKVPELKDGQLRELIVQNYRLIYRVEQERISIAAVIHGARLLRNAIRERGDRL